MNEFTDAFTKFICTRGCNCTPEECRRRNGLVVIEGVAPERPLTAGEVAATAKWWEQTRGPKAGDGA